MKSSFLVKAIFVITICLFPSFWSYAASVDLSAAPKVEKAESASPSPMNKEATVLYEEGMKVVKSKNFTAALDSFSKANEKNPNHPLILNMLAYSQRKLGKTDEALANYKTALALQPDFPQAREYLGEAHIQAALHEIQILKSYGPRGKEELDQLVSAFHQAASKLESAKRIQKGYEGN